MTSSKSFYQLFVSVWTICQLIPVAESTITCFECSTLDDTDESYCPEFMTKEDETIVPYNSCSRVHEAAYCIKSTGVTGGNLCLECFSCDDRNHHHFVCTHLFLDVQSQDCSNVFDALYCIKTTYTNIPGGSLGTRRFCSSRDMGNYCEYIKRPGDQHLYRSCVYTCSSNGCNPADTLSPHFRFYTLTMIFLMIGFLSSKTIIV